MSKSIKGFNSSWQITHYCFIKLRIFVDTNGCSHYNKNQQGNIYSIEEVLYMNMRKLWQEYSFILILFAISCSSVLVLGSTLNESEDYIKVTVQDGESVWKLAEKFADNHTLSPAEFVAWVEKENGITGEVIHPGDQLVIPVMVEMGSPSELTAFAGE